MKKIVPFKKDIVFDTNIALINSISLEHEVTMQKEGVIKGKFIVSGDYKITDASSVLDAFEYELPFNISVDKKYNIDSSSVVINDFYYEIVNSKILTVSIELLVDNINLCEDLVRKEDETLEGSFDKKEETKEVFSDEGSESKSVSLNEESETKEVSLETESKVKAVSAEALEVSKTDDKLDVLGGKSIFDNLDENENYVVYKVHIVTENDTTESIINDYGITREDLESYNNLSDVKIGDKIIVPANEG